MDKNGWIRDKFFNAWEVSKIDVPNYSTYSKCVVNIALYLDRNFLNYKYSMWVGLMVKIVDS